MTLNPFLCTDLSISDSLRSVRKSVLIYEAIIYSMQIAMLKQLLRKELINEKEYEKIKKKLMEEYKIVSDLVI